MDINSIENENISVFTDRIFERSSILISSKIWEGIEQSDLTNWIDGIGHFDNTGLLAACLLDNMIYRSKNQFLALLSNIVINSTALIQSHLGSENTLIEHLSNRDNEIIFATPVIADHQPPTKSGPYVLRLLQRQYRLHDNNLKWPFSLEHLPDKARVLICIDDFCGTGDSFIKFCKYNRLQDLMTNRPDLKIYYFVTVIHKKGFESIKEKYPFIEIVYSDYLSEKHDFYSDHIYEKYNTNGLKESVLKSYEDYAEFYNLKSKNKGYGKLGLTFSFFHCTPNNSLPILWNENKNWTPLVKR